MDATSVFSKAGLRCTRQRVVIFETLNALKTHPTADELHRAVNARVAPGGEAAGVSLATIYNALDAFCHAGLVRKIPLADAPASAPARFELGMEEHLHVLTPDGGVLDVPEDLGERILAAIPRSLIDELEARMACRVRRVRVDFVGSMH